MAMPKGSLEPEGPPNRRRLRESPRGSSRRETGKGFGSSRDPNGVHRRGFGLGGGLRGSGKAFGRRRDPKKGLRGALRLESSSRDGKASGPHQIYFDGTHGPASFERATGEASASMRARGDGAASAGPDPPGKRKRDFGPAWATRRGSARGFGLFAETHRVPNGASRPRSGTRGKAKRASCPPRDPKPPSERWPRHPATAVKAGTSGGRWRHRPPL
jgi:hypothetical protein